MRISSTAFVEGAASSIRSERSRQPPPGTPQMTARGKTIGVSTSWTSWSARQRMSPTESSIYYERSSSIGDSETGVQLSAFSPPG